MIVYILLSKQSDKPISVVKVYDTEQKAVADRNMLELVAKDTKFRILQSEFEKSVTKPRKAKVADEYGEDFCQFWAHYPKERRQNKGEAWKAWKDIRPPLYAVLNTLAWQVKSQQWLQEGGKYIPMPTTYINKRKWQDEQADVVIVQGGKPWFIVGSAIEKKGQELGLLQTKDELAFEYYRRVQKAAGITPDMVQRANNDNRTH